MLYIKNKEITAILAKGKVVQAVYRGSKLVWQAIRSCFGSGWWVNTKPWVNTEAWRNK